jgi:hypothetical protein
MSVKAAAPKRDMPERRSRRSAVESSDPAPSARLGSVRVIGSQEETGYVVIVVS